MRNGETARLSFKLNVAKRGVSIPWGATQASDYLLKLMQLKYPTFPTRMSVAQTSVSRYSMTLNATLLKVFQWLLQNKCEFATDYPELIRSMNDPLNIKSRQIVVQFPFNAPTNEEKTEEDLARMAERRREQGKKLQEIAAKARQEKASRIHSPSAWQTSLHPQYSYCKRRRTCST